MQRTNESRRKFLKTIGLEAACLCMPELILGQIASAEKPNIVYILADDMGYGDPYCYGQDSKIPTPNIDRVAAEGMSFSDAHSGSAVCSPTRYGILTGRYAWRSRLKDGVLLGFDLPLIESSRLTVASLLKQQGYNTACVGKWHLGLGWTKKDGNKAKWADRDTKESDNGWNVDFTRRIRGGPLELGFDYYYGISASMDMAPFCFIENDHTVGIPNVQKAKETGVTKVTQEGTMVADWKLDKVLPTLTEKAVGCLENQAKNGHGKPFFLYFALTAPHLPWVPIDSVNGKSRAGIYGDFVYQVDMTIGEVMQALDRLNLAKNTLVIVTSDNGAISIAGAEYGHLANDHLRGQKADAWDGGHRIPFIARWHGKIKPGSTCDQTICLTDLMATCAAIVGAKLPDDAGEDSYNILPALLGRDNGIPIREATVHHSFDGMFAIRRGPWKLILGTGSGGFTKPRRIEPKPGEPTGQLYNMEEDPEETKNLYLERPEIVHRLSDLLQKYQAQGYSNQRK